MPDVLDCTVTREITFTCHSELKALRLVEHVAVDDQPDASLTRAFEFGYVIPGSVNTWSQCVEMDSAVRAAGPDVLPSLTVTVMRLRRRHIPLHQAIGRHV